VKKLKATLNQKLNGASRVAVLGIGSEIRGDDAAGIIAAQQIEKISNKKKLSAEVKVLIGETAPENLTGEIKKFKPSHLIIIDSADINTPPGRVKIINSEDVGGTSFCTHCLPIKVMVDYLLKSLPEMHVIIIGIQPKTIAIGSNISIPVRQAAEDIAATISDSLGKT
jgi:hydrogenase 3 maturation protease